MFYFLSKALDFLVMPFSIFFILCAWGLLSNNSRRRKVLLTISFCCLVLTSNSYLVNKMFNWWEFEYVNIDNVEKEYDIGIVLSGGLIGVSPLTSDHPSIGSHSDRFVQAYLLYKAGKIKKILLSGFSPEFLTVHNKGEIGQAANLLIKWGVKPEDIILETKAKNTRENAIYTSRILQSKLPSSRCLLITSSFHMKRAIACFAKAGIKAEPFPADFYGGGRILNFDNLIVPKPDALANFDLLWHEWIGYLIYKLMGYC
ncbi:YdcF family protein [Dyadobacter psychrotolerans]|uniref:YdcF family protein n=1 Tax=Dyadobacter psychrotolerans TaxID=2541721 RepID=A0A4R5DPK4_9BACT|nr:YdcF family protein [Dyadobacter psychrotolerans]TDE12895.1 YdcF family protein [Dyadobacter psychrotolerans]